MIYDDVRQFLLPLQALAHPASLFSRFAMIGAETTPGHIILSISGLLADTFLVIFGFSLRKSLKVAE